VTRESPAGEKGRQAGGWYTKEPSRAGRRQWSRVFAFSPAYGVHGGVKAPAQNGPVAPPRTSPAAGKGRPVLLEWGRTVEITVTPEVEHLIEAEVRAGNSPSAAEFLTAAVQHYVIARDLGNTYTREEIEEKIARGLAQIEQGETIDGDEAFLQLRSESAERRRRRA